ncbi:MAG: UDP-N-acetylmuramate--L-alanine ligase [Actinomycetota bacterium]
MIRKVGALDPSWGKVHLVGIGGSGMSAIARVLSEAGFEVSGSDLRESSVLASLRSLGVTIHVGHDPDHLRDADLAIVSAAVDPSNPEVEAAVRLDVPILSRGEALALIVGGTRTIAISGTHGKTTTSGMVATILETAGTDPTYLLGADLAHRGAGGHLGAGVVAVVEADEAYGSFLWLRPAIAVVTNVDEDHLDHYGNRQKLDQAFSRFLSQATESVVVCQEDSSAMSVAGPFNPITYGFSPECRVSASSLEIDASTSTFDLALRSRNHRVCLRIGGRHNVLNALAAAAACSLLGIGSIEIVAGLEAFSGVSRRFEFRGTCLGADLIDDYAHHPAEIDATLVAARGGPWKRLIAVFQPHLYSRTQAMWREFGRALCLADMIVVTDIYGAREQPLPGITGKLVVDSVCEHSPGKRVAYLPRLEDAAEYLAGLLRPGDLLLSLGAGDVTTLPDRLIKQ